MAVFVKDSVSAVGKDFENLGKMDVKMLPSNPQVDISKLQLNGDPTLSDGFTTDVTASASTEHDKTLKNVENQGNGVKAKGVATTNGPTNISTERENVPLPKDSTIDSDAIEKGLEDLSIMRSLTQNETDYYMESCKCPTCKANRRNLELGDEKFLFDQVVRDRSAYMKSLEQSIRILSRKFNREQNEGSTSTATQLPPATVDNPNLQREVMTEDSEAKVKEENAIVPEMARMIAYEDEDGDFLESLPETEKPKGLVEKRKKTYAIELSRPVRRTRANGRYNHTPVPGGLMTLTVNSMPLIEGLRKIASYHPAGLLERDSFKLSEPFDYTVHHLPALKRHVAKEEDQKDFNLHLNLLDAILEEKYGEDIQAEKALHEQTPPRCTFKMLWYLFEKGQDVFAKVNGEHRAFVVSDTTDPKRQGRGKQAAFLVQSWYIDFDGKEFGRTIHPDESVFNIFPFQGTKEITSLPVYPANFHTDKPDEKPLRQRLEERGSSFFKLRNSVQRMYTGECLDYGKRWIDSRVMVDYQTYARLNPDKIVLGELEMDGDDLTSRPINGCNCIDCLETKEEGERDTPRMFEKYDHISKDAESLTPHQYMLCTNRVPGYYLQDRKWVKLDVAKLIEYTPKTEGFKQLVLPEGHKDIIEALIQTRKLPGRDKASARRGAFTADLVVGKGKGLIILLHGAPGVGKTSTAECVAELTNLPLFPITCGDIGTNASEVEENLKEHFELAQLWNAVLLLDEADVFLQSRDIESGSLQRNSLVSVFLRVLEYYEGILFLTTNRVGDFDEAFKSRIHVILYYPKLQEEAVTKIWRNLIESLEVVAPGITLTEAAETYVLENKEMRRTQWNGRQIRNAFQTAVALAEYEQDPQGTKGKFTVSAKHFKKVVELSQKFEKYMKDTRGGDDSTLAKNYNYRLDDDEKSKSEKGRRRGGRKADRDDEDDD